MDIFRIAVIGIVAVMLAVTIKKERPEIALVLSMAAGILIIMLVLGKLTAVIRLLELYSNNAGIGSSYLKILLKIIGIAYIAEFASQICKDAGETSISGKIDLASKIIIIVMGMPIITSVLDLITKLI